MTKFRCVSFACQQEPNRTDTFRDDKLTISEEGGRLKVDVSSGAGYIEINRAQVAELYKRLGEWLGEATPPTPKLWEDC